MKATTSAAASSTPAHNAPLPPTTSAAARSSRIAPHSHIKGLGLNNEGYASSGAAGFIGQIDAREVRNFLNEKQCCVSRSIIVRHAAL